jgi:hypothetical protein
MNSLKNQFYRITLWQFQKSLMDDLLLEDSEEAFGRAVGLWLFNAGELGGDAPVISAGSEDDLTGTGCCGPSAGTGPGRRPLLIR